MQTAAYSVARIVLASRVFEVAEAGHRVSHSIHTIQSSKPLKFKLKPFQLKFSANFEKKKLGIGRD